MLNELKLAIDCLAFSFVQVDGCTISFVEAQRLARDLIMRECSVYRAGGTPFGESLTGFLRWLSSAERLTPSA